MANYPIDAPAFDAAAVNPSDTTHLGNVRALYIGVSGDVAVKTAAGTTVTFTAHPVGYMPVQVVQVLDTGTDATDIVALY